MGLMIFGKEVKKAYLDGKEIDHFVYNGKIILLKVSPISEQFWTEPDDFVNKYNGKWVKTMKVGNAFDNLDTPKEYFINITPDLLTLNGASLYYKEEKTTWWLGVGPKPTPTYTWKRRGEIRFVNGAWEFSSSLGIWFQGQHQNVYGDGEWTGAAISLNVLPGIVNHIYETVGFTAVNNPAPNTDPIPIT